MKAAAQLAINFRPQKPRAADSVKGVISELFDQVGGVPEIMLQFGIGKSQAYAWTDPLSAEQMSFDRVARVTSPEATAAAKYLAERSRCVLVPLPGPDRRGSTMTHIAESARSHGEAIAEAVKAAADGVITPTERAAVRKEIAEAISDLVSLQASMEDGQ